MKYEVRRIMEFVWQVDDAETAREAAQIALDMGESAAGSGAPAHIRNDIAVIKMATGATQRFWSGEFD